MNQVTGNLSSWAKAGLALLYPEVCQICHEEPATPRDGFVGPRCRTQVQFIRAPFCDRCGLPFDGDISGPFVCTNCQDLPFAFTSARSAVVAKNVVLETIHQFKYSRALWFENFLAGLLVQEATPVLRAGSWDGLVPVPLFPVREREREFNQSALLARHLGRALGIPCEERLLRRTKATETQTHLDRAHRAVNMREAFALARGARLKGRNLVLIDDVFTTGATTNDCARALRAGGAAAVCVWTVARGL